MFLAFRKKSVNSKEDKKLIAACLAVVVFALGAAVFVPTDAVAATKEKSTKATKIEKKTVAKNSHTQKKASQSTASVGGSKKVVAKKSEKTSSHGNVAKATQKHGGSVKFAKYSSKKSKQVYAKASKGYGAPQGGARTQTLAYAPAPNRMSFARRVGLNQTNDALDLRSSAALVVDQHTGLVLFNKNENAQLPIASITKLMTAMLILERDLPLNDMITITDDDRDYEKGTSSRLDVGTTLSRGEMLHLALMSSENRAAHALGRTYPGGVQEFVRLMNQKAAQLGMKSTTYSDPTGLSSRNQSSAYDLAILVSHAYRYPLIRGYSTALSYEVPVGTGMRLYRNTNLLVREGLWDIGLQKTGYIAEAGHCLVMQANISGRSVIMVFLDASGKMSRFGDAERVRQWLEQSTSPQPVAMRTESPM